MKHGSFFLSGPTAKIVLSLTILTLAALLLSLFPLSPGFHIDELQDSLTITTASFPAGTLVHTREGLKSIEDIPAGFEVLIPGGGWAAVNETVVREAAGLVLLEGNGFSLQATPEHPFLITRGVTSKERSIIEGLP
ncbi:MAG: hypothetical protein KAJ98_11500, partial [Spirochaetaceae bacterium]|nr:hypothetical protein [Spirochaetaceae bacterium]